MPAILRQLRGPLVTALVIAVSVLLAWLAATAALSRPASAELPTSLASLLQADYGEDEQPQIIVPLDGAIIEEIQRDAAIEVEPSAPSFVPIFFLEDGNQEPLPLPAMDHTATPARPPASDLDIVAATPTPPTLRTPEPTASDTPDKPAMVEPPDAEPTAGNTPTPWLSFPATPTPMVPTSTPLPLTGTPPSLANTPTPSALVPTSTTVPPTATRPPEAAPTPVPTRTPQLPADTPVPPSDVGPTATSTPQLTILTPELATPTASCRLTITSVRFDGDRVRFEITNSSPDRSERLQAIEIGWDRTYGHLTRIKLGEIDVFREDVPPPSLSIDGLSADLAAGLTQELRFEFELDGLGAHVAFTASFSSGCVVHYSGSEPRADLFSSG